MTCTQADASTAPHPGRLAGLRRSLAPANVARVYKILRAVRFFRGHRYVFPRAASALGRLLLGKRALRAAEISLGNACQLRCLHCYATVVTAQATPLGLLEKTIAQLGDAGCLSVLLVGGEPTLRKDLPDVVRRVRARRMLPFVFTNGLLLDARRIEELRDAGLFGLLVSLLGTGERHDRFVGQPGAYVQALETLRLARDAGLFVSANTTATRACIASGDLEALVRTTRELGVGLKINYPALLGRWAAAYDQLLDPREIAVVHRLLGEPHVTNDMLSSFLPDVCPAARFSLYVTDRGDVTPCAYIPVSFGNVLREPLAAIHERMASSPYFSRVHRLCLVGEDRAFVEEFVSPAFRAKRLPMAWWSHPRHHDLVRLAGIRIGPASPEQRPPA